MGRLAVRQHGVFTFEQWVRLGLSSDALQRRADAGRVHRIHKGVCSLVPPQLLSRDGRYMAAVLACGPGAALSFRSAGVLLRLIGSGAELIDVSVPTAGGRSRRRGIRIHRTTTLRPQDVVPVHRIACTSVARTILDLCEVLDRRGVERAIDEAALLEILDLGTLRHQIERNAGSRAAAILDSVLAEHLPGSTPTWNDFEERFLALSRAVGLPDPEVQATIDLGDGEPMIRADFLWRAQRLIVETDGYRVHGRRGSFESDRRRDQRALLAGWGTVRVTWRQLTNEPGRLGRLLLAMVDAPSAAMRSSS